MLGRAATATTRTSTSSLGLQMVRGSFARDAQPLHRARDRIASRTGFSLASRAAAASVFILPTFGLPRTTPRWTTTAA